MRSEPRAAKRARQEDRALATERGGEGAGVAAARIAIDRTSASGQLADAETNSAALIAAPGAAPSGPSKT